MSSKTTGGKGGKAKSSTETKVLTTRSTKAGLQVRINCFLYIVPSSYADTAHFSTL